MSPSTDGDAARRRSFDHALATLLRRLECTGPLARAELEALARLPLNIRVLNPRQDILRSSERPGQCCLIVEGWACCYKLLSEGRRQILAFHLPGDLPDLATLHLPLADRSMSTLTKTTVAFIPHESLRELSTQHLGLANAFSRIGLTDTSIAYAWLAGLGRRSAYQRMAHLFCELYLRLATIGLARDRQFGLPVTQFDLADVLGLSSVHVNRTLQELRGEGLITLSGGKLTIHDWRGLVEAAEFDPAYLHLPEPARVP